MKYMLDLYVYDKGNLEGFPIPSDGKERNIKGYKVLLEEEEDCAILHFGDQIIPLTLGSRVAGDKPIRFNAELQDYDKAAKEALDYIAKKGLPEEPYDKIDEFDRIKNFKTRDK